MTQNPNDDITMEKLENQITLETLDHLIINAIKEIRYSKKKRPDENSIFEYLNKTLENSELSKQYIESRLSPMIVDGKLEKKCTNGQTSFYIKKLENELSRKTDESILTQKSPSPIICRTPSRLTFSETEYHKNEITTLYEKLREITTEMKEMKSFVTEQILLIKNSVNDKLGNNAQLQEKSNQKYLIKEIRHLREENKTKT